MEDVQSTSLTPPTDSGISQQQINNAISFATDTSNNSTSEGLAASMHVQSTVLNKGKAKEINVNNMQQDNNNTGSSSSVQQHWKTVEKRRNFRIAMLLVHLPGETDTDKKTTPII